jgi:tetratricopeptide (TPR) repeat protein
MKCRLPVRALLAVLLTATLATPAPAQTDQPHRRLYTQVLHGTAWVIVSRGGGRVATGTAWVVDRPGKLLITNYHVVGNADTVSVVFPAYRDGKVIAERSYYTKAADRRRGRVLAREPRKDLALIQLESMPDGVEAIPLAAESADPGDQVHTVGNPGASGALWVYTSGTVRQVYRKKFLVGKDDNRFTIDARVVETQTPTNPGDSGGPVVNDGAELVAVNDSHEVNARLVSICIDVSEVRDFLAEFRPKDLPRTAQELARSGYEDARRGQFAQAVRELTEAIKLDPKYPQAYLHRGASYVSLKEYDKAIADLDKAIELRPTLSAAYSNRGAAYANKKEYDKALADLDKALELNPKLAAASFNRGRVHYEKGDYDKAIADLTEALKRNPKSANAYLWRGRAYAKKGDEAKAEADRKEAQRLNPKLKEP